MELINKWQEVINNPFFQNIPFKVELIKFGRILISPASNKHGILRFKAGQKIESKKRTGIIIIECSILTSDGVKVADVAWASDELIKGFGEQNP